MTFIRLIRFSCHASCAAALTAFVLAGFPYGDIHAKAQGTAAAPDGTLQEVLGLPPAAETAAAFPPPAAPPPPQPQAAAVPPPSAPETGDNDNDLLKKIESDPVTPPAEIPQLSQQETMPPQPETLTPAPQEVDESQAPQPPAGSLASPQEMAVSPVPLNPQDISAVAAQPPGPAGENLFFDSDALGGPAGQQAGVPRTITPQEEGPAASMIVVTKDYDQNSPQAQVVSAQRALQLRRYDAALRIYNQLYEKNNRDPNILLGRAVALQHMGQEDEAIHTYEELLQLKPENIEAQINMLGLIGEHYPAVALQRLHELSATYPNDVRVLAQTAVMEARSGNYSEALGSLGMAASLDQTNANHVYNMAVVADRAGRKAEAINYYEKALEIDTVYGAGRTIPRDSVYDRLAQLR